MNLKIIYYIIDNFLFLNFDIKHTIIMEYSIKFPKFPLLFEGIMIENVNEMSCEDKELKWGIWKIRDENKTKSKNEGLMEWFGLL